MDFVYEGLPTRVVFAKGARARVAAELERLGVRRALVLSTPPQEDQVRAFAEEHLGGRVAGLFAGAAMHTPVEVTEEAMAVVKESGAEATVAFGGGSTIGLGKAIALRTGLPQLAIPTTFAGSEMTPILGQTEAGRKTTLRDPKVLPQAVIYDPDLVATLPAFIAGPSGMNAIAHAIEALYAESGNPIISLMAQESIRALGTALPRMVEDAGDEAARGEALYGAWLAGLCLGSVGMAIHHKICHTLGGSFDLPHADVHCLMIPYSAAYNREAAADAMSRAATALQSDDAPRALFALLQKLGVKKSLAELGMAPADIDRAADIAVENPYYNPRPVTRDGVRDMLQAAYEGRPP